MRKFPDLMTMLHMSGFSVIFRDLMRLEWIEREMEKMFSIWQSSQCVCIQMVYFALKKTKQKKNTCYLGCNWLHTLFSKHKDTPVKAETNSESFVKFASILGAFHYNWITATHRIVILSLLGCARSFIFLDRITKKNQKKLSYIGTSWLIFRSTVECKIILDHCVIRRVMF